MSICCNTAICSSLSTFLRSRTRGAPPGVRTAISDCADRFPQDRSFFHCFFKTKYQVNIHNARTITGQYQYQYQYQATPQCAIDSSPLDGSGCVDGGVESVEVGNNAFMIMILVMIIIMIIIIVVIVIVNNSTIGNMTIFHIIINAQLLENQTIYINIYIITKSSVRPPPSQHKEAFSGSPPPLSSQSLSSSLS